MALAIFTEKAFHLVYGFGDGVDSQAIQIRDHAEANFAEISVCRIAQGWVSTTARPSVP
jgi:hypothetical protein